MCSLCRYYGVKEIPYGAAILFQGPKYIFGGYGEARTAPLVFCPLCGRQLQDRDPGFEKDLEETELRNMASHKRDSVWTALNRQHHDGIIDLNTYRDRTETGSNLWARCISGEMTFEEFCSAADSLTERKDKADEQP